AKKGRQESSGSTPPGEQEPSVSTYDPQKLGSWTEFHQQVEALPAQEREVFGLLWYHRMSQADAAAVLNVSLAPVKRWWRSARLGLEACRHGKTEQAGRGDRGG